jgi:hypothetical protein
MYSHGSTHNFLVLLPQTAPPAQADSSIQPKVPVVEAVEAPGATSPIVPQVKAERSNSSTSVDATLSRAFPGFLRLGP